MTFDEAVCEGVGKEFVRTSFDIDGVTNRYEKNKAYFVTCSPKTSRHHDMEYGVFGWLIPKIPGEILTAVRRMFRVISEQYDTEALVRIYWDGSNYLLSIPTQYVSHAAVETEDDGRKEGMWKVLEIHSHGSIPAFFSRIDDEDECFSGVYGVIGGFPNKPEMLFRATAGDMFTYVHKEQLFDMQENADAILPTVSDLVNKWKQKAFM